MLTPSPSRQRIAIIGAGISGLGAAYALKDNADITVFEKRERLGGHACTVDIDYDGAPVSVDVGFIVCNNLNYRNVIPFFEHLGVDIIESDMSFSVSDPNGFEWSSDPKGLFAWKRNLLNPRFIGLLREILAFNKLARAQHASNDIPDGSLGDWLDQYGFSERFRRNYLLPMGAAIWSTPEDSMLDYPARSLISFFDNHRLMHADRPTWRTLSGGSRTYVDRAAKLLGDRIRTGAEIERVIPSEDGGVELHIAGGEVQTFDQVIMAGHADQSLRILSPGLSAQCEALSKCRYAPNKVYLHRDEALMPVRKAAWASWNVMRGQGTEQVCVSYWMNRLQDIAPDKPLFVTLNPTTPPRDDLIFGEYAFDHPQFDGASEAGRAQLTALQGQNNIWFAGAWLGDGFHEAGMKSGLAVALALGGEVPWAPHGVPELSAPQQSTSPIAIAQRAVSASS